MPDLTPEAIDALVKRAEEAAVCRDYYRHSNVLLDIADALAAMRGGAEAMREAATAIKRAKFEVDAMGSYSGEDLGRKLRAQEAIAAAIRSLPLAADAPAAPDPVADAARALQRWRNSEITAVVENGFDGLAKRLASETAADFLARALAQENRHE